MRAIYFIAISFLVVPLVVLVINNVLSKRRTERIGLYFSGAVALTQMISAVVGFFMLDSTNTHEYDFTLLWDMSRPGSERLSVTALSLVILFCIGFVALVSVLIAFKTVDAHRTSYINLLMTLMLGMNGMIVVTDLFSLYVFLEIVSVSSFVMIALFKSGSGLEGAFKYLVMSSLASLLILTGLSFIFMHTGSMDYIVIAGSGFPPGAESSLLLKYLSFILLLSGFAIKTGAIPFHSWLPDAHQSADTAVSVLLSGIVIKVAGIYGLIVFTSLFKGIPAIDATLKVLGTVTIIFGALFALRQNHFKRIVAYSSVSQMGYIILGLSTGSTLGLLGAVIHIFNHATFKSTLFSNAAALHEQTGTLDINEMGGLHKRMPVTGTSSVVAFLSTAGIPPFAGFWSKLLIVLALWASGDQILGAVALGSSLLTAAYFMRIQRKVFFGDTPERLMAVNDIGGTIKFSQIMLTCVMTAVGLVFPFVLIYLKGRGLL